ncbi:MAG: NADH-quinone oxidoreductase subunit J [Acetobacteraceae bacterium]|nr:NADH-quinone oxidoreductase subunit J [Acetobacteraceae bacterium]
MIASLAFYLFAAILLVSAGMVVTARNPVHSVLFLVLAFFNAAVLFLLAGAEFLAMILVIVYVGAVAVLFLFVVMMLDINFAQLREGFQRYLPIGATVAAVLLIELAIVLGGWTLAPQSAGLRAAPMDPAVTNTVQLGKILYTDYILLFQAAGLVLLVAMIGAIVLTLRDRSFSRHQSISAQVNRQPEDTLELVDMQSGAGTKATGFLRPKVKALEPMAGSHGHDDSHGGHH